MKKIDMNKIFEQSKDLHVRNYVVYGNASDNKLYYEATYTNQVTEADLVDAFVKGALLIDDGTNKLVPVSIADNTVKTIDGTSSSATLVTWTAKAAE